MKKVLFILGICLSFSCSSKVDKSVKTITIEIEDNSNLKDFVTDERIIRLETNDDCLISEIDKICINSEFIFIKDKKSKKVFIFNDKGLFISKIDSHGNGPDEYIELSDIAVNDEFVYVLSKPNKSIYIYTYDGKYKRKINLDDWYHRLNVTKNYIMLYSCKSNRQFFDIITIDHNGKTINKSLPFAKDNSFVFDINPFNEISDEEYLLCFPYERRVVLFSNKHCEYKYKFDFNTKVSFTEEDIEELGYEKIRNQSLHKESLKQIDSITKIGDNGFLMIATLFIEGKGLRKVLCKSDFDNSNSITYTIGDEINEAYPSFNNPLLIKRNNIYCIINPDISSEEDVQESNPSIGVYSINSSKL